MTAFTDYAYFAWAKYRVSQSSYSWDNLLQTVWQRRQWTFSARYRLKLRQRDNDDKTALTNRWEHRGRLSADYDGGSFGSRTQFDGGCVQQEWGMMLSQSLSYTYRWLRLNGGVGYYHTDSYDSRVYLYERGPLYTYTLQQFYGEGVRYWLMARANIGKSLLLTAKVGVTSSKTDLDLQVRWKF